MRGRGAFQSTSALSGSYLNDDRRRLLLMAPRCGPSAHQTGMRAKCPLQTEKLYRRAAGPG